MANYTKLNAANYTDMPIFQIVLEKVEMIWYNYIINKKGCFLCRIKST